MAEVSMMPTHQQRTGSDGLTARPPLTLAGEHVLLLRQVAARAEELLATARRSPPDDRLTGKAAARIPRSRRPGRREDPARV